MPKRILLLLLCSFLVLSKAWATHIVGGEFELQYLQRSEYRLTLNLYFDDVNGSPGALDPYITVNIFQKSSNRLMQSKVMPLREQSFVPYTNIDCTVGSLRTRKLVYNEQITLPASQYSNPAGYYVTWERCCRNRTISNIVSPENAAQTFYMEFPAVVRDGQPFINSSPRLFPPLSDYACINELFYFDFDGTDPDGDSLVYDMVTPLNGFTSALNPNAPSQQYPYTPRSGPYPEIGWLPGYSKDTQIKGNPAMNINARTGQLTMRPQNKGLYVFGVRCQEFRNGVKIGEVRRDFQVLVLDCQINASPQVMALEQGQNVFYQANQVLRLDPAGSRCIEVLFTDPDLQEFVQLRAQPVNFDSQDYTLNGVTSGTINQDGTSSDTLRATLCFDECFDTGGKVYQMDLIVKDDGCSLPRQDTVHLNFVINPVPDAPPALALSTPKRVFEVQQGDVLNFDVTGTDSDGQDVTLTAKGLNFDLASQPVTFENQTKPAEVTSPFLWQIDCSTVQQESYQVEFTASSVVCGKTIEKKEVVEVRPIYKNNVPSISTDQQVLVINLEPGQPYEAKVFGKDIDLDALALSAAGNGFNLGDLGMDFTSTGGQGSAEGLFRWVATCNAATGNVIRVNFNLKEDACVPSPDQQLVLEFHIIAPNDAPVITTDKPVLSFDLNLNEPFEAKLFGDDINLDPLRLRAEGDGFNLADYGMNFTATDGKGKADGTFNWVANCKAAGQEVIRVNFKLAEDACTPFPEQVLTMEFRVTAPQLADFLPPNIFTPNDDGLNDYFEIPGLPTDFCSAVFSNIVIYNRWGKEVFRSTNSDFKWDGKGVNVGVYFYVIDFGTSKYKGSITIAE
ncbi:gliding motility-associated C-terminal domain-containing protein [Pontibacter sp. 172403-2]|uniref:gliding motility-associated C-terminal domain-containing protein n=1 Tax=Pontibacter rufus TaxID=2791028 RepID=UPI0018AF93CB|nr:gliding motility-associated C-terminal domain-containing protein [Pontibacter sp. 172403-2]MBF9254684.1 gliding motility-associated C-terminal domain-containing protein [Pontibacter sp. 172403-2]